MCSFRTVNSEFIPPQQENNILIEACVMEMEKIEYVGVKEENMSTKHYDAMNRTNQMTETENCGNRVAEREIRSMRIRFAEMMRLECSSMSAPHSFKKALLEEINAKNRSPRHSIAPTESNRSPRGNIAPESMFRRTSPWGSIPGDFIPAGGRSPRESSGPDNGGNKSPRGSLPKKNIFSKESEKRSPRGSLTFTFREPLTTGRRACVDNLKQNRSPRHSIAPTESNRSPRGNIAPESMSRRTSPRGSIASDSIPAGERSPRESIGPDNGGNRSPRGSLERNNIFSKESEKTSPRESLTLTFREPLKTGRRASADSSKENRSPRHSIAPTESNRSPRGNIAPESMSRRTSPRGSSAGDSIPAGGRSPRASIGPDNGGNRSPRGSLVRNNIFSKESEKRSPRKSLTPAFRKPLTTGRRADSSKENRSPRHSIAPTESNRSPRGNIAPESMSRRTSPRGSIASDSISAGERSPRGSIGPDNGGNRSPRGSLARNSIFSKESEKRSPRKSLTLTFREPLNTGRRASADSSKENRSFRHSIVQIESNQSPRGNIAPESMSRRTSPRGSSAGDSIPVGERSPRGSIGPDNGGNRSPRGSLARNNNFSKESEKRSPRESLTPTFRKPLTTGRRTSADSSKENRSPRHSIAPTESNRSPRGNFASESMSRRTSPRGSLAGDSIPAGERSPRGSIGPDNGGNRSPRGSLARNNIFSESESEKRGPRGSLTLTFRKPLTTGRRADSSKDIEYIFPPSFTHLRIAGTIEFNLECSGYNYSRIA
ncbi:hypothetical protein JTB14_005146 [Gonioctena quinquepunctata]|nr:hypothetical protein JTB14_005146 [Gonioctena quinquepunctata]